MARVQIEIPQKGGRKKQLITQNKLWNIAWMKRPITKTIKTLRVWFLTGYVSLTVRNYDRLVIKQNWIQGEVKGNNLLMVCDGQNTPNLKNIPNFKTKGYEKEICVCFISKSHLVRGDLIERKTNNIIALMEWSFHTIYSPTEFSNSTYFWKFKSACHLFLVETEEKIPYKSLVTE